MTRSGSNDCQDCLARSSTLPREAGGAVVTKSNHHDGGGRWRVRFAEAEQGGSVSRSRLTRCRRRRPRTDRDDAEVRRTVSTMLEVARGTANLVAPMLDASPAAATPGEGRGAP